jgi:ribokinase
MRRRFDIVGVGYTALDYLGVVPRLPAEDGKLEIRDLTIQGGGPAATAMVAARRLGASAALVAKVGDDDFGRRMLDELRAEDVDCSSVAVEPGASSQFAFIMVNGSTASRTVLWTRGTVSRLRPDEVDLDLVGSARGLLVDDLEPAAALVAARHAHARGIPVLIDAGSLRDGVVELLPHCDYIFASERFAERISGSSDPLAALAALDAYGPKACGVTLGGRGCVALARGEVIEAPGFDVDAVDTTGAGDVFHAALLFAVLEGWDIERCCVFANAVAALKCRRLGGRAGIPGFGEAVAFLGRERPELDFTARRIP